VTDNELPEEANSWPGVLDEIEIKYVPVEYISSVEVTFSDGKTWSIEIDKESAAGTDEEARELEDSLEDLFEEYEDVIEGVNFILDIEKVKKDITDRTKLFMKKKK
jgi:hypothetical protein